MNLPTQQEIDEKNKAWGGLRGPYPHPYMVSLIVPMGDGTWRREVRTYNITGKRTPDEELRSPPWEMTQCDVGPLLRRARDGETPECSYVDPTDFTVVGLVTLDDK